MGYSRAFNKNDNNQKLAATAVANKITDKAIEEGVQWASKNNKLIHIFRNPGHNFGPLVEKLGSQESVVRSALNGVKDKLPAVGEFEEIATVGEHAVHVRGVVIDGVPKLGTMFIK